MSEWHVETYARIRPLVYNNEDPLSISIAVNDSSGMSLNIEAPPESTSYSTSGTDCSSYNMTSVFGPEVSQSQIFDQVVRDLVNKAFEGINSCLFAYGQTGSGKTFTMFGGGSFESRGVIPRCISSIFNLCRQGDQRYKIYISFIQVYKESIVELLSDKHQSGHGSVFQVLSEEDALNLMFLGQSRRISKETDMNKESSRSHSIFSVYIESESVKRSGKRDAMDIHVKRCGKITLVDLAGSEKFHPENDLPDYSLDKRRRSERILRQDEGRQINLSLHYLEQTIVFLSQHSSHVPYRNSTLTRLLADCLGGNCKTRFLLNINPSTKYYEETCSTCRFAVRCSQVSSIVQINEEIDPKDEILLLRRENEDLRSVISNMTTSHQRELDNRDSKLIVPVVDVDLSNAEMCQVVNRLGSDNKADLNGLSKKTLILMMDMLQLSLVKIREDVSLEIVASAEKELKDFKTAADRMIDVKQREIDGLQSQLSAVEIRHANSVRQVTRFVDEANTDDCPANLVTHDGLGSEHIWRLATRGQTFIRVAEKRIGANQPNKWSIVRQMSKYSSNKSTRCLCYVWCSQGLSLMKMREVLVDDVSLEEDKNEEGDLESTIEMKEVDSVSEIGMGFRVALKSGVSVSFIANPVLPVELRVITAKKWLVALNYVLHN